MTSFYYFATEDPSAVREHGPTETTALGVAGRELTGVLLHGSLEPLAANQATHVLKIEVHSRLVLDNYVVLTEDGRPTWSWCVPAQLLTDQSTFRWLRYDEIARLTEQPQRGTPLAVPAGPSGQSPPGD